MDAVIQHLIKGQEKLEWAVERQWNAAQADRNLFKNTVMAQLDSIQRAGPPTAGVVQMEPRGHTLHPSGIALQKYVPGDDPDAFLINFERAARALGWPEEKWPCFLAPLLTGEAQFAYQVANPAGNAPYPHVKAIILDHLGLDPEAYRVRFRREKGTPGENPKTLFFRLKMMADKWLQSESSTKEEILARIYLEQFMEALPYGSQRWLRQHSGLTIEQAIEMAANYARAQPRGLGWEHERPHKQSTPLKTEKPVPQSKPDRKPFVPVEHHKPKPWRTETPFVLVEHHKLKLWRTEAPMARGPQCFECGEWGHIARLCPRKHPAEEPMEVGYLPRTVLYSAEMGPSFYPHATVPEEEWANPEFAYPWGEETVPGLCTFNADSYTAESPPREEHVTTKEGGTRETAGDGLEKRRDPR
ncbi:uncharacterized protein LOC144782624 [Lissotriton helveticus]